MYGTLFNQIFFKSFNVNIFIGLLGKKFKDENTIIFIRYKGYMNTSGQICKSIMGLFAHIPHFLPIDANHPLHVNALSNTGQS